MTDASKTYPVEKDELPSRDSCPQTSIAVEISAISNKIVSEIILECEVFINPSVDFLTALKS